eukprot:SAG25_NODE_190_length_12277_cov_10.004927_4_plen_424_part_00
MLRPAPFLAPPRPESAADRLSAGAPGAGGAGGTSKLAKVVLPPALARAMSVHRMPKAKRMLLRIDWAFYSNIIFLVSMVGYVVEACWWLGQVEHVPWLHITGNHLRALCGLAGAVGFMFNPVLDICGCWVEAWDGILWTAFESAERLSPRHAAAAGGDAGIGLEGGGEEEGDADQPESPLSTTFTAHSAMWLMTRTYYFWGGVIFQIGSVLYLWAALLPFLFGDYCDNCVFIWERAWFACADEANVTASGWPDRRRLGLGDGFGGIGIFAASGGGGGGNFNHSSGMAFAVGGEGDGLLPGLQSGRHSGMPQPRWPRDTDRDQGYCASLWFGASVFFFHSLLNLVRARSPACSVASLLAAARAAERRITPSRNRNSRGGARCWLLLWHGGQKAWWDCREETDELLGTQRRLVPCRPLSCARVDW